MKEIILPDKFSAIAEGENKMRIEIAPLFPGYGTTLGNAVRRVLLSSLPGAAATAVKIKGAEHEFSTLPGVKEDMVDIILNIKQIRFKIFSAEPQILTLKVKGEKQVTAKDFTKNSQVEVISKDIKIATITEKETELEMEVTVEQGRGYVPVEMFEQPVVEIGKLLIDAIFTPIKNVGFVVENVRLGQMTNYDKLILTIETDGTLKPDAAFKQAAETLVKQFTVFNQIDISASTKEETKAAEPKVKEKKKKS